MVLLVSAIVFAAVLLFVFGLYIGFGSSKSTRVFRERLQEIGEGTDRLTPEHRELLRMRRYSELAPLERFLSSNRLGERVDLLLTQAGTSMTVGAFLLLTLCLVGGGWLLGNYVRGWYWLGALLAVTLGALPYMIIVRKRNKRYLKFAEQLPDALELIANALRAGLAFSGAMRMVAHEMPDPVGGEFWVATEEHKLGLDVKEALVRLSRRIDIPDVRFVVTAVSLQRETGGNLAEILDNTTTIIRDRFRVLSEARVFSAQGRMSGLILIILPIFVAAAIMVISPDYLRILLDDPTGKYMLIFSVCLQLIGILIIRKIVRIRY